MALDLQAATTLTRHSPRSRPCPVPFLQFRNGNGFGPSSSDHFNASFASQSPMPSTISSISKWKWLWTIKQRPLKRVIRLALAHVLYHFFNFHVVLTIKFYYVACITIRIGPKVMSFQYRYLVMNSVRQAQN